MRIRSAFQIRRRAASVFPELRQRFLQGEFECQNPEAESQLWQCRAWEGRRSLRLSSAEPRECPCKTADTGEDSVRSLPADCSESLRRESSPARISRSGNARF